MKLCALMLSIFTWLALSAFQVPNYAVCKHHFIVQRGNEKIGKLTVVQKNEGDKITYTLTSDVVVQFLFTIQAAENIMDVFENGKLVNSSHQRYVNGTLKADHALQYNGMSYTVIDQDNRVKQIKDQIDQSVLSIYFNEPKDGQQVYSQNFQCMLRVVKTKSHCYAIELPNGTTTTYQYEQGILKQVISDTYWGSIKFTNEKE